VVGRPSRSGAWGFLANLLLVDGGPATDVSGLQQKERLGGILKGGKFTSGIVRR
jgi:hypothetical protein